MVPSYAQLCGESSRSFFMLGYPYEVNVMLLRHLVMKSVGRVHLLESRLDAPVDQMILDERIDSHFIF